MFRVLLIVFLIVSCMETVSNAARVFLLDPDTEGAAFRLFDALTGESVDVPEATSRGDLQDREGQAWLRCPGPAWASERLNISVWKDNESGQFIMHDKRGDDMQFFTDFARRYKPKALNVAPFPSLRGFLFDRPNLGGRLWLSLTSIHEALSMEGEANRWIYNCMRGWRPALAKYGILGLHLRRSVALNKASADAGQPGHAAPVGLPQPLERLLHEPSVSVQALRLLHNRY
jgi:hypothetical protein